MPTVSIDHQRGVACEIDPDPMVYGSVYLARYERMDKTPMGRELTHLRLELVRRHLARRLALIDVGIGGGAFLNAARANGYIAFGYDVNPHALRLLGSYFADPYQAGPWLQALTLWDSLEHLPRPELLVAAVRPGQLVFASLPICPDLKRLRDWKHFRPNEHHWYWTAAGFERWAGDGGLEILEANDLETQAGRQDIRSYAMRKRS